MAAGVDVRRRTAEGDAEVPVVPHPRDDDRTLPTGRDAGGLAALPFVTGA